MLASDQSAPSSSSWVRETLDSCVSISERMQNALLCPFPLLLQTSQWQCLARSYSAVAKALVLIVDHACSSVEPSKQARYFCQKLSRPLRALHEAVQEGETCMQESTLQSISPSTTHSWLLEKALKQGLSTEVVDLHLQRLLWTFSVVVEQILRCAAQNTNGLEDNIVDVTTKLCDIWSKVDSENDLLIAGSLIDRIVGAESEESARQLASFVLQKLSCPELMGGGRISDAKELPSFFWVDPKVLKKEAEIIGEGAYGNVREAVWLGGRFAVKEFFYVEDKGVFGREVAIQAQLHHPNVMPLICCSYNFNLQKCTLVMERMEQDLMALMIQRKRASGMEIPFPDLSLAVGLMLQIAQGMEYLHSVHVMHRDIKSTNILVSISSRVHGSPHVHLKVADFGMSKAKYTSSRYTTKEIGATAWRAPEVFDTTEDKRYTNKADVYSFGIICYEILTGKVPFENIPQWEIRRKVLSQKRPDLPAHCPPALASFIEMCWQEESTKRPTFTQICRMLRYFKACIFLGDHNASDCNNSWLLHPLSARTCEIIDDMLQYPVVQQFGGLLRPQPLAIPLEMFICRELLQDNRYEAGRADKINSLEREDGDVLQDGWEDRILKDDDVAERCRVKASLKTAYLTMMMCTVEKVLKDQNKDFEES